MAAPRRVEFSTFDGVTLRGNLYLPGKEHSPAIVMSVGLTFLKEHLGDLPDLLRAQGYAVLTYDPRSWGSSDGVPRQHINLVQQSEDMSDAITFVCNQAPAIDPKRVCVSGAGHGAGVLMPVAATDPRVKAAIGIQPFISGFLDSKAWPKGHERLLWEDRVKRASSPDSSLAPMYVPIFPDSLDAAQKDPQNTVIGLPQIVGFHKASQELSSAAGTPWENKLTISSLFHNRRWEPTVYLPQVKVPFLYITAKHDEFTAIEHHLEAYERIKGPKDILVLESENLAAFTTDRTRKEMLNKQIEFLQQNL